jgi:hypothetical protein
MRVSEVASRGGAEPLGRGMGEQQAGSPGSWTARSVVCVRGVGADGHVELLARHAPVHRKHVLGRGLEVAARPTPP